MSTSVCELNNECASPNKYVYFILHKTQIRYMLGSQSIVLTAVWDKVWVAWKARMWKKWIRGRICFIAILDKNNFMDKCVVLLFIGCKVLNVLVYKHAL